MEDAALGGRKRSSCHGTGSPIKSGIANREQSKEYRYRQNDGPSGCSRVWAMVGRVAVAGYGPWWSGCSRVCAPVIWADNIAALCHTSGR